METDWTYLGIQETAERHRSGALLPVEIDQQLQEIRSRPPAPYRPPEQRKKNARTVLLQVAKPAAYLVGGATSLYVAVQIVLSVIAAVTGWISANAGLVTGMAAGVGAIVIAAASWSNRSTEKKTADSSGSTVVNHFHQYNYFGQGTQENNRQETHGH